MVEACTQGIDTGFVSLGYAKVAFLGIIQGITELLPISSTAHMRIVPALLGWTDPGSAFSAAMQMAALAAVVSYFRHDVVELSVGTTRALLRRNFRSHYMHLTLGIILGTIPIVVMGVLLSKYLNSCGSPLRGLWVIGASCIVMALLLALAEMTARHKRDITQVKISDALIVGLAQVGALIPGVSRSGSTLTAALWLGFQRDEAARYSFLLGIPAIIGAGGKEIWELHKAHIGAEAWGVLGVGLVTASLSAFVAIWSLMRIMERFSAWPFVIYRAAMGIFLLYAAYTNLLT
ncbi:undecaprenyl-diphosphatase UppP [Oryzifoliimicrobium ureilyticus]|uniref:undecaprenyl-diphosphatase UppP n=1 Tax=Oryzifoliimicrobium ureilyticus TaxID=3113724 RepID=UPI0030761664